MSQTNAQRKKQQKSKARERAIRKIHNIQRNAPEKRYRLDVLIDNTWRIGVRSWAHTHQIDAHKADTERRRANGEEIVPGRVVDTKLWKLVLEIPGSRLKGMAPDKIMDGVKAADDFRVQVEPKPEEKPTEASEDEELKKKDEELKKKSLLSRVLGR